MIFADIPCRGQEGGEQASRKNPARLQRVDTENLAGIRRVVAPVINDVEDFCADDSAQHDEDAEVPGFLAIDAQALGVAHADPKADQDSGGDEQSIGGKEEASVVKELRVHSYLDAG